MDRYNQIITKSLIDFEEIKFILANNNIKLVNSYEIKERYFLKNCVNFKTASYDKILQNSYVLAGVNQKLYLSYTSVLESEKTTTKIEISNEKECVEFLNHIGLKESFTIEKNVYVYSGGENQFSIINLIGIGLYLSVVKENTKIDHLKEILSTFNIPYDEENCNVSLEKLFINKLRRHIK